MALPQGCSFLFVAIGLSAGFYLNSNAQTDLYICGFCDEPESIGAVGPGLEDLEFCNTSLPAIFNGCLTNNGYECDQFECSVEIPDPVVN